MLSPHSHTRSGSRATPMRSSSQDQEWCEVLLDDDWTRIRFHDYGDDLRGPGPLRAPLLRAAAVPVAGRRLRAAGRGRRGGGRRPRRPDRARPRRRQRHGRRGPARARLRGDHRRRHHAGGRRGGRARPARRLRRLPRLRPARPAAAELARGALRRDDLGRGARLRRRAAGGLHGRVRASSRTAAGSPSRSRRTSSTAPTTSGFAGADRRHAAQRRDRGARRRRYQHRLDVNGDPIHYVAIAGVKRSR